MTTQAYYKDRLGFDPNDPREMSSLDPTLHGYEENLSKFKGNNNKMFKRKNVFAGGIRTMVSWGFS